MRRDIKNVNDFFKKKGVHVFKVKAIFEFIVVKNIKQGEEKEELERMIEDHDDGEEEEDEVFNKIYIPSKLE